MKDHDLLRAYALTRVTPGERFLLTLEWHGKTYSAALDEEGNVVDPRLFVEHGGEAVVADPAGNVYVADGQIFVYDASGRLIEVIAVPERPLGLALGGEDRRTLFIPTGRSLYAVRLAPSTQTTTTNSSKETP